MLRLTRAVRSRIARWKIRRMLDHVAWIKTQSPKVAAECQELHNGMFFLSGAGLSAQQQETIVRESYERLLKLIKADKR